MGIRIITLSENTAARSDVLAEWGFSVLIEAEGQNILMDAAASITASYNAEIMGIDLQKINRIVLSHGHFDHSGGLRELLKKIKKEVEIIAHPDIWAPKYSRNKGKPDRYIGLPYPQQELESLGARFRLTTEPVMLTENIMTTGEIPLVTDFEKIEPSLYVQSKDDWKPDPLLDDLSLVINTQKGLVVILGCAHRGMINTLYRARTIARNRKIHMVIGGSHLKDAAEEQVWQTISSLNELGVQKLGVSHCTGMPAMLLLAQTYGKDFIFNFTGNIINLE